MDKLNETSNVTGIGDFLLAINQTDNFTAIEGLLGTLKRIENYTSITELRDVYNSTTIEDFIDAMSSDLDQLNNPLIWDLYKNITLMVDNHTITEVDDYFSFAHNISDFNTGFSNMSHYNSTFNISDFNKGYSNMSPINSTFSTSNINKGYSNISQINSTISISNLNGSYSNLSHYNSIFYHYFVSLNETDNFTAIEGFLSALKRIDNFTSIGELLDIYNSTSIENLIIRMSNDLDNLKKFHLLELITDVDDYFGSANNISHFESFTRSKLIICSQDWDVDVPWEIDPPGKCQRE